MPLKSFTTKANSPSLRPHWKSCALGAMAAAVLPLASSPMQAEEPVKAVAEEPPKVAVPAPAPPSRFHALANFEFSNEYLTPRGMIVHDDGLTFQLLMLGLLNVYHADTFINDFTLVGGMWNYFSTAGVSVHPPFGSNPKTSWVEIDPIAGVSMSFAKDFKLDVSYTAFNMQVLDIPTSQHLETKLSFDDSSYLKQFAVHPYAIFWKELVGKATAADVPFIVNPLGKPPATGPGPSYYVELGITPGYTFKKSGLKLEAPLRMILANPDFYGEYYAQASTVGLYELGARASIPLNFIPQEYGHWGFHVGVRYQHFVDENLQGMQQFNAPGEAVNHSTQVYGGFTAFF